MIQNNLNHGSLGFLEMDSIKSNLGSSLSQNKTCAREGSSEYKTSLSQDKLFETKILSISVITGELKSHSGIINSVGSKVSSYYTTKLWS